MPPVAVGLVRNAPVLWIAARRHAELDRAVFSASTGYESALRTSREPFQPALCLQSSGCPPHYEAGTGQVSTRYAIGFVF
jgi:hypothetical protein